MEQDLTRDERKLVTEFQVFVESAGDRKSRRPYFTPTPDVHGAAAIEFILRRIADLEGRLNLSSEILRAVMKDE